MLLKRFLPKSLLNLRHLWYAWHGALKYGRPSEELLVIGVTGTSGKSSTIYLLKQLLEEIGFIVGTLTTVEFSVAGETVLNDKKMTMLGKMEIQRYLRKMAEKKCDIAIVEVTSEGYLQHRHRFINFDKIILTNLYPEHIDSHGSFENYKVAKLGIFEYVSKCKVKNIKDLKNLQEHQSQKEGRVPKSAIVNGDSEYAEEFLGFGFNNKIIFGVKNKAYDLRLKDREDVHKSSAVSLKVFADKIDVDKDGLHFDVGDMSYYAPMYGEYNVMNILAAMSVAKIMKLDEDKITKAISKFSGVPGRIEFIPEAKEKGFQVIVDYAFEPVAIEALYKVVKLLKPERVIHVFGSTGGGRDVERRFSVGKFVGENADICIVTDEDPYDDDPRSIMDDVADAVEKTGKKDGEDLFIIEDRGEAIQKAVIMADKGDLVLVTGKGSEQAMVVKGELVPWDDRMAVREALSRKS